MSGPPEPRNWCGQLAVTVAQADALADLYSSYRARGLLHEAQQLERALRCLGLGFVPLAPYGAVERWLLVNLSAREDA